MMKRCRSVVSSIRSAFSLSDLLICLRSSVIWQCGEKKMFVTARLITKHVVGLGLGEIVSVNKQTFAGCKVKIWIADWFAQLNNKIGG
ncbi:unnamed protein product [Camellia sinensis]